jgi:hypothetical protein
MTTRTSPRSTSCATTSTAKWSLSSEAVSPSPTSKSTSKDLSASSNYPAWKERERRRTERTRGS